MTKKAGMPLIRNVEFKSTGFGFADEYGADKDLTKIADRVIRAVQDSSFKKAWIPLVQGQTAELSLEDLGSMHSDSEVIYILPTSITPVGFELKYVFTDGTYSQKYGAIDGNVVIMELTTDFTKEKFKALLEKAADAVPESAIAEAKRAYERAQVQKFVDSRIKARKVEIERDCVSTGEQLAEASNKVIYLARRREELEILRLGYAAKGDEQEKVEKEIAELFDDKDFRGVRFDENLIVFSAGPLGIKDAGGKYHPIGDAFDIEIKTDTAKVFFKNLKNHLPAGAGVNIPHPHCGSDGHPCLGNIATVIPELIAAYDILGLWQVCRSFLCTYTPEDSWGRQLRYWPYVDENGEKKVSNDLDSKLGEHRETFHCDHCRTDHRIGEFTPRTCPVCHETFCLEGTQFREKNGVYYCSQGCLDTAALAAERGLL